MSKARQLLLSSYEIMKVAVLQRCDYAKLYEKVVAK